MTLFPSRRAFLWSIPIVSAILTQGPTPVDAALVQFPQSRPFANSYHLLRVGETLMEQEDIWSTNPLFLTNREDALSPKGQEQIVAACQKLKARNQFPTVLRYSLAAAAVDTANVVGRELKLGRDRLGAEFTFLDPRAIGQWDMLSKSEITPAVWALDHQEAGADGEGGRPPPNVDGTPHETLGDQMIRLRQLFSLLETQYSGDTILLVFPDGTGPAVMSAMIAGIPLNRVHELEFAPGEVRLNVDLESVQALWRRKQEDAGEFEAYQAVLEKGSRKLQELRSTEDFVNRKDARIEAERRAIEEQYNKQQAMKQRAVEEKLERQRQARLKAARDRAEAARERREQQQQQQQSSSPPSLVGGDDDDASVIAIAGGSFLTVLGATQLGKASATNDIQETMQNNTDSASIVGEAPVEEDTNTTATASDATSHALPSYFGSTATTTEFPTLEDNNTTTVVKQVPQLVNGSRGTMEKEVPVDPYMAAQKAMDEYLTQDDGGDAWLLSLSEMMVEEPPDTEPNDVNQTRIVD